MIISKWYIILLGTLLIGLLSCASPEKITPVTKRSLDEVLDGLKQQRVEYEFFSAKARIKFNGEDSKVGGRSNIRMIKDSLIWMNFKKLSIEGARTLITPDSCWVLYRFDDIYESGTTQEFLDYYKIYLAFGDLQDMLVGNLRIPSSEEILHYEAADYYHLVFQTNGDHYEYLLKDDYRIFKVKIKDTAGREFTSTFRDYGEEQIASRKDVSIHIPGEGLSTFSMKFSSIEIDVPKKIKFEIPDHYTRLP